MLIVNQKEPQGVFEALAFRPESPYYKNAFLGDMRTRCGSDASGCLMNSWHCMVDIYVLYQDDCRIL